MTLALSVILAALKILGAVIDKMDAASKQRAHKALLDAARMEVEDDVAERARAAYSARLHPDDGVPKPYGHYRD